MVTEPVEVTLQLCYNENLLYTDIWVPDERG